METRLGTLRLTNPIVGAAGVCGAPPDADRAAGGPATPLGATVTASFSARSRAGRSPRLWECPAGAVYAPGEAQTGMRFALRRHARVWAAAPAPVVVSLVDESAAALAAAAAELEGVRGVAAIELNLTAPEPASGVPFGFDARLAGEVVRAVRRTCALPLWAKLPVDTPDAANVLAALSSAGAFAATMGGGLLAGSTAGAGEHLAGGYLVGPATFPVVLALVQQLAAQAPLPLIACGGVATAREARAYLRAGAAAVQVGSAHLANPYAAQEIASALTMPP